MALREQLSQDEIVDTAIRLAGDVGVDRLTMRVLGDELGVTAMALYHYIPNKSVLLQLLADRVIEHVEPPAAGHGPWDQQLARLASALRSALGAYPGVGPFLLGRDIYTPAMNRISTAAIAMLVDQGFSRKEAALAFTAMHNLLLGRLIMEDAFRGARGTKARRKLDRHGTPAELSAPADEHFAYGLTALLVGIRGHSAPQDPM